ncbi:MAG: insulinase family protein [Candidatus Aminicenantes bacterium]|nr:MAG: insulinase family protein [Candidatus Aminicenantes bacterium]
MYTQNNNTFIHRSGWLALTLTMTFTISLCLAFPFSLNSQPELKSDPEPHRFKSTKGLRLMILKSQHIPFIHAQLVIYYQEKIKNPAVPYLTLLNIFDRNLKGDDTNLLSTLKKLGNDFEVEHRPDFLIFKINFLPDKVSLFTRFLKALYSYKPFLEFDSASNSYVDKKRKLNTLKRFEDSITNYWNYFFKGKDWKIRVAYQIAYSHFFSPRSNMGQTLITPENLKRVTLNQLRSFYLSTYQLPTSRLILKGNIENPAILHGHIERALASFKTKPPRKLVEEKFTINSPKKIIVFNTRNDDSPDLYWFEAVSTFNNGNPIPVLVLNNILFAYPTGRLYINAWHLNINISRLQTEMVNHLGASVICNTLRLRYSDIDKFILLIDRERRKLRVKEVEKREYLNTLSNIYGRLKVNSRDFENDVNLEIIKTEYYTKKVTLASLNQITEDSNHAVIVIVGSARMILPQLGLFRSKVEVIDFNR